MVRWHRKEGESKRDLQIHSIFKVEIVLTTAMGTYCKDLKANFRQNGAKQSRKLIKRYTV